MNQIFARYIALLFALLSAAAFAQDMAGSKDHPALKRFAGSTIVGYEVRNFESVEFQTSTFALHDLRSRKSTYVKPPLVLEGKLTRIWYEAPGETTSTELFRNYSNDLASNGFNTIYDSTKDAEAKKWVNFLATFDSTSTQSIKNTRSSYIFFGAKTASIRTGTFQKDNTTIRLVAVDWGKDEVVHKARKGAYIAVDILETKAMEQNMVVVSASEMSRSIASTGKVAIYGIFFDTNKADVKPESKPSLEQIASYLRNEPNTRLHVVGHTDNVGGFEGNISLSKRRADAVVATLARDYSITPNRLTANGVAYLAPVSTNSTEEGRAKNRRVELVLQ
jgi:OmpA-OmpF porin, OOP family